MDKTEIRELTTTKLEIREENDSRRVEGYAVKWGLDSKKIGGRFVERFQKGAFAESLRSDDQFMLKNHDRNILVGFKSAGSLHLEEDDIGLRFAVSLPNTTAGNDLLEEVRTGLIKGASFAFRATEQEWDRRDSNNIRRLVKKADLFEVSLVNFPAYPDSEVSLRGHDPFAEFTKQAEHRKRLILLSQL